MGKSELLKYAEHLLSEVQRLKKGKPQSKEKNSPQRIAQIRASQRHFFVEAREPDEFNPHPNLLNYKPVSRTLKRVQEFTTHF